MSGPLDRQCLLSFPQGPGGSGEGNIEDPRPTRAADEVGRVPGKGCVIGGLSDSETQGLCHRWEWGYLGRVGNQGTSDESPREGRRGEEEQSVQGEVVGSTDSISSSRGKSVMGQTKKGTL